MANKVTDENREPLSGFRFSKKANWLLSALCTKTKRNRTLMLEYLIEMGAEAEGIAAPADLDADAPQPAPKPVKASKGAAKRK